MRFMNKQPLPVKKTDQESESPLEPGEFSPGPSKYAKKKNEHSFTMHPAVKKEVEKPTMQVKLEKNLYQSRKMSDGAEHEVTYSPRNWEKKTFQSKKKH